MPTKTPPARASARGHDESRQTLVEAATELFAERGFDATTTRDIAAAAGLNISLISYYFGGKEGLLDAVLAFVQSRLIDLAAPTLVPAADVADFKVRLKDFVATFLASHAANPKLHRLVQREHERDSPAFQRMVRSRYVQSFNRIIEFLAAGQRQGWIAAGADPTTLAIALHGGIVQQVRFDRFRDELQGRSLADEAHRARVVDDLVALFIGGLLVSK